MNGNPYAPPQAAVSEVIPGPPAVRPREVTRAVVLLWIGVVIGDLFSLIDAWVNRGRPGVPGLVVALIALPIGLLIVWWFTGKILKGRNWARILVLISVLLLPFNIWFVAINPAMTGQRLLPVLTQVGPWPLYAWACWLVFSSPGKEWFRRRSA